MEDMEKPVVGLLGEGALGIALSRSLIDAGYDVITSDSTTLGVSADLRATAVFGSAAQVAEFADVIVTAGTPDDFLDVLSAAREVLEAKRIPPVIDTTTLPVSMKSLLRKEVVRRGSEYLDAPVAGSPAMVEVGTAEIYVSGDRDTYLTYRPLLKAMCRQVKYVGTSVNGSKVRLVGRLLATIQTAATIEALLYARQSGLGVDVEEMLVQQHNAARGLVKRSTPRVPTEFAEQPTPTLDATTKEAGEVVSYAGEISAPVELTRLATECLQRLSVAGWGDAELSALFIELMGTPA